MTLCKHHYLKLMLTLLMGVWASSAQGLSSDSQKRMYIHHADTIKYDDSAQKTILIGHVHLYQGTTHFTCQRAILFFTVNRQVKKLIAYGEPAYYSTIPKPDTPELHAKARAIRYLPVQKKVWFIGNSRITQDQQRLEGEKIFYNMNNKVVRTVANRHHKSVILINPKSKQHHDSST